VMSDINSSLSAKVGLCGVHCAGHFDEKKSVKVPVLLHRIRRGTAQYGTGPLLTPNNPAPCRTVPRRAAPYGTVPYGTVSRLIRYMKEPLLVRL